LILSDSARLSGEPKTMKRSNGIENSVDLVEPGHPAKTLGAVNLASGQGENWVVSVQPLITVRERYSRFKGKSNVFASILALAIGFLFDRVCLSFKRDSALDRLLFVPDDSLR